MFENFEVICTYSTKQAIADGCLVPVDETLSAEAGIRFPVILTNTAWNRYVNVPAGMEDQQDQDGRLWDLLFMFAINAQKAGQSRLLYYKMLSRMPESVGWYPNEKRELASDPTMRLVTLKAVINARDFDDPSPAIFIMLPGED